MSRPLHARDGGRRKLKLVHGHESETAAETEESTSEGAAEEQLRWNVGGEPRAPSARSTSSMGGIVGGGASSSPEDVARSYIKEHGSFELPSEGLVGRRRVLVVVGVLALVLGVTIGLLLGLRNSAGSPPAGRPTTSTTTHVKVPKAGADSGRSTKSGTTTKVTVPPGILPRSGNSK